MAVTGNATVSRLGQALATGDALALFLKEFGGEVLTMFGKTCVTEGRFMERTISSGKSAQFPVIGSASASYHTAGQNLLESNNAYLNQLKANEVVISIDSLLIAPTFIADIDEAQNHYDVRAPYSTELGRALAYKKDKTLLQLGCLAARGAANITGVTAAGTVSAKGATVETSGADLASALFDAAATLDNNAIPSDERVCYVRPTQYNNLVKETDNINQQWGGKGAYSDGTIFRVAGIEIVKTIHLPSTNIAANTGENNTYSADFSNTIALVAHKGAIGTVKLMDLEMQSDYLISHQGTLMVARYAMGHGILRPECAVEITKA